MLFCWTHGSYPRSRYTPYKRTTRSRRRTAATPAPSAGCTPAATWRRRRAVGPRSTCSRWSRWLDAACSGARWQTARGSAVVQCRSQRWSTESGCSPADRNSHFFYDNVCTMYMSIAHTHEAFLYVTSWPSCLYGCDLIILSWFYDPVEKSSELPGRRLVTMSAVYLCLWRYFFDEQYGLHRLLIMTIDKFIKKNGWSDWID